jgi:hypothetical protein
MDVQPTEQMPSSPRLPVGDAVALRDYGIAVVDVQLRGFDFP